MSAVARGKPKVDQLVGALGLPSKVGLFFKNSESRISVVAEADHESDAVQR